MTMADPVTIEIPGDNVEQLRKHVGADASVPAEDLAQVWAEADALVTGYGTGTAPAPIINRAILECASELWARRDAPGGIVGGFTDAPTVRLARDPMLGVYPLLVPYKGLSFS